MSKYKVLGRQINWNNLYFYQKADTLYQLTYIFCQRFMPPYGDRTVDQMIQAARSGKQNIVEGLSDGVTSTETQLKLLNVGRSSFQELQKDFEDHIVRRKLTIWDTSHSRYNGMLTFCREHNKPEEYKVFFEKWQEEEMVNIAITLCHMVDKMMITFLEKLEEDFVKHGGIKERMYSIRTGYRKDQDEELQRLRVEVGTLRNDVSSLRNEVGTLRAENKSLRQQVPILKQQIEMLETEKKHLQIQLSQARKK